MENTSSKIIAPMKPHLLLDTLREANKLTSDAQLADSLEIEKAIVSYIRNGKMQLTPLLTLKIYDNTNLTIEQIRELWASSLTT
jgi:plasmid maintenance system antidote protein VapI